VTKTRDEDLSPRDVDDSPQPSSDGKTRFVLQHLVGSDCRSDERQEMEHRILVAAASLFNRKGFVGATTRELAKSLGLQRASLYHYLESKQDLLYALCVASLQIAAREFAEAVEAASPAVRLRAAIRAHVEAMTRDQDMHAVMMTELRSLDPERQVEVKKLRAAYERQVRDLLCAEQKAGRLRSDIDCKYLALVLLNLLNWPIFWYRGSGPMNPGELGELLADLFLEGAEAQRWTSATATLPTGTAPEDIAALARHA
jgi:AcrR family transcriptional regulator